jgi:hypothetical protein
MLRAMSVRKRDGPGLCALLQDILLRQTFLRARFDPYRVDRG